MQDCSVARTGLPFDRIDPLRPAIRRLKEPALRIKQDFAGKSHTPAVDATCVNRGGFVHNGRGERYG